MLIEVSSHSIGPICVNQTAFRVVQKFIYKESRRLMSGQSASKTIFTIYN